MNSTTIQLRKTLIALLDDQDGINAKGYEELQSLAVSIGEGDTADIFNLVESSDGRYYLPEDHNLTSGATEHIFADCGGFPRCTKCGCDEDDAFVGGQECTS
jgi:hypothetical protein